MENKVEEQLEKIYTFEELQWQKRGGGKWILAGDANNCFFHGVKQLGGKENKCTIFSLEDGDRIFLEETELMKHIVDYYKSLFGSEQSGIIHILERRCGGTKGVYPRKMPLS